MDVKPANYDHAFLHIHKAALDVFTSADAALAWLTKPHPLLDGMTPAEAAQSEIGAEKVHNLLMSTKFGGVS